MSNPYPYALLRERAKREAHQLRREAIDAFWRGVAHAIGVAWRRLVARTATPKAAPCPR